MFQSRLQKRNLIGNLELEDGAQDRDSSLCVRVARWYIFIQKYQFGNILEGLGICRTCWNIFVVWYFYCHSACLMAYITAFWYVVPKNLATM
jgi:hypothetical protein